MDLDFSGCFGGEAQVMKTNNDDIYEFSWKILHLCNISLNRFTKFLLTFSPIVKLHKPEVLATQVIEETFNKIWTNNLDFAVPIENMPFSVLT